MSTPCVTVSIPSYNHAAYLPQTLECLLGQTFQDFEVLIADDGSTDNSLEIIEFYARRHARIRVLTHPGYGHRGIAATSNLAAEQARGRYVAWLDSDDLWYPDTLARRVEFMENRPDMGLMCSFFDIIDEHGLVKKKRSGHDLKDDCGNRLAFLHRMIMGCDIGAPSVMIRRECLESLGLFEDLVYCDWEMWTRVAARYPIGFYDDTLVMYRRHGRNFSSHLMIADDLSHRVAVMQSLLDKSVTVKGLLVHPRIQAVLHLQLCCFEFCLNRRVAAARSLVNALMADRALLADGGKYFYHWLSCNPPVKEPRKDFHHWILKCLQQAYAPAGLSRQKVSLAEPALA
ncbi:MAG: glycosyltransferase [Lentisphaerota bacterium]